MPTGSGREERHQIKRDPEHDDADDPLTVNFRVWQNDIVIRVASGAKLAAAVGNLVVAFETDELDPDLRTG